MMSGAFQAVLHADHPSPENGGPCATCAFRIGTEANRSEHTTALAALCVEGLREFRCHEKPQLCRGWIAAVNAKHAAGEYADKKHLEASRFCADFLSDAIDRAVDFQNSRARDEE